VACCPANDRLLLPSAKAMLPEAGPGMATLSDMFAAGLQQIDTRRCVLPVQAAPLLRKTPSLTRAVPRPRCRHHLGYGWYLGCPASPSLISVLPRARLAPLSNAQLTFTAALYIYRVPVLAGQMICSWSWTGGR